MSLRELSEAIRLNPGLTKGNINRLTHAYINRGATYNALGQYQSAIPDLDQAIKVNPLAAVAYNNRGNSTVT